MIFISHTSKDKLIVEPIASKLADVYGMEKVFYDSWSIQPGDGIIDKMNEGLSECEFFFFFVSKNSLQSNMVKLEWQNAILRATNAQAKIIPVKLDDCMMPAILMQTLYIDVYGKGFDNAVRQMIDVINGRNTYHRNTQTYENVRGYVKASEKKIEVEFRAETYMEPISRYAIVVKNSKSDVTYKCTSDGMCISGFNENAIVLRDGTTCNVIAMTVNRPTSPGFPVKVTVTSKTGIEFIGLMKAINEQDYSGIPHILFRGENYENL